jgi:hypothetical protein
MVKSNTAEDDEGAASIAEDDEEDMTEPSEMVSPPKTK